MMQPDKKTPTEFSGVKPDSVNFENEFIGWTKERQLEYISYLERDTIRYGIKLGFVVGLICGIALGIVYLSLKISSIV